MVFFGGNWTNNQHYYNKNNHNNHNNTNHSRETKQQQTQTQSDEQCPLLRHNTDNDRSYREHKRLFPVYEKTNQHVTDNDDPPPPPSLNQQQHSYIQSVLFGGLWTRNSLNEQSEPEQGDQDQDDEEQDRPSLTSHFEADTDLAVLKLCAIYTILYVLMAIVAFSFVFERWSIIDSTYFAVATFTTVGYGDLQPTTVAGQLFTIAFSVYGVIILGIFIGIFGHAISMGQQKALQRLQKGRQRHLLKLMFQTEHKRDAAKIIRKKSFFRDHISLLQDVMDVVRIEFPEIVAVIVFAMILGFREGWSLTSTLYFAIMSASTTGYGDYTPHSQVDKLYCVFFLPFSVAVFGEVLGRIASIYIQRRTREAETKHLQRALTHCDLRNMDADEDGMVSMDEWLTFMLVMLQKVDRGSIEQLRDIFHSMDRNGNGFIDKEDLVHLQQTPQWKTIRKGTLD